MVHEARVASETLGNFLGPFKGTSGQHASGCVRAPCSPDGFDAPLSVHMFRRYRA